MGFFPDGLGRVLGLGLGFLGLVIGLSEDALFFLLYCLEGRLPAPLEGGPGLPEDALNLLAGLA